MPKSSPDAQPPDALPADSREVLRQLLEPAERVVRVVIGVGASLVLTDRRLILVREGVTYRPKSGVQTWPLDRTTRVRHTPVRHGTGRLVVDREARATSVFVAADRWPQAEALIGDVNRAISGSD